MKRQRGSLSATSISQGDETRPQPAMVDRFLIEERIGRGGMSDVYRALDPELNRYVALKVLSPALGRNPEFTDRFIRESRSAAQLNHPHVVPIFEAGADGDTLFIAMQLVRGVDLKRYIETNGPLPLEQVLSVISQAAAALDHAHENGLLHRDVKPANLMLEERDGELHVYLTDFGLTKSLGTDSRITHTGELVGSVHYVSPEHLEGRELDTRTDVYSLGCVLHECLTGRPPFERDTDMAVLWAHLNAETPRPSRNRRHLPNVVDRVVARALAKGPQERFATCGDLARSLEASLHGLAVDLPVPVGTTKPPLRHHFRGVLAIVASIALFTSSVVVATRDWSPSARSDRSPSVAQAENDRGRARTAPTRSDGERRIKPRSGTTRDSREARSDARDALTASDPGSFEAASGSSGGSSTSLPEAYGLIPTRKDKAAYDFRARDVGNLAEQCSATDTSATGCEQFRLAPGERFVDIVISDQGLRTVGAFIRQDFDNDPYWDGPWFPFCDSTDEPIELQPGARVQVLIDPQGCGGDSDPTFGTIHARFFEVAR